MTRAVLVADSAGDEFPETVALRDMLLAAYSSSLVLGVMYMYNRVSGMYKSHFLSRKDEGRNSSEGAGQHAKPFLRHFVRNPTSPTNSVHRHGMSHKKLGAEREFVMATLVASTKWIRGVSSMVLMLRFDKFQKQQA